MKIISYVIHGEDKTLLDEYIAKNSKDFSTNQKKIRAVINIVNSLFRIFKVNLKVSKTNIEQRTSSQNRAYWLWLTMIIEVLEKEGVYAKGVLDNQIEWTKEVLHHTVTHDIIFKEYGKVSTTQLNTNEIELVIERYTEMFGAIGVELPKFPCVDGKLMNDLYGAR